MIPADLETVCLKCLEKEPARRYATAQELAEELGRFLEDEPVQARSVSGSQKIWRWCRRKPALATLGALVIVLFLVVVVGTPIAIIRIDRARIEADRARQNAWAPVPLQLPARRKSERWWWYPGQQAVLAVNDKDRTIVVYRLLNFEEVSIIPVPGRASHAAVSADLRTLALAFQETNAYRRLTERGSRLLPFRPWGA